MHADAFCDWGIRKSLGHEGGDDDDEADEADPASISGGGSPAPKAPTSSGGPGAPPPKLSAKARDHKTSAAPGPLFPRIPEWKRKLSEQRRQANAAETMLVQASRTRELVAQDKLAKLKARAQRELQKAASSAALEEQLAKKQQTIQEMKAELDKRTGRDVTAKLADVPLPDEEEVCEPTCGIGRGVIKRGEGREAYTLRLPSLAPRAYTQTAARRTRKGRRLPHSRRMLEA